jgi:prolyl-tRNA synthetase
MRNSVSQDLIKSHKLLVRSGMISQLGSGLFFWLPLGMRVLNKVRSVVSKYHEAMGFNECCSTIAQPAELWIASGRYNAYGEETMRVTDRHKRELILGPTSEETFVETVKQNLFSHKDMPINLYNIQWKFRDEVRPRFGIMRCREFLMCDGYSFHLDQEEAERFYNSCYNGYIDMYRELGFTPIPMKQEDTGEIGGKVSHEYFACSETGENNITFDEQWLDNKNPTISGNQKTCRAIELGHIFMLGIRYSQSMNLSVDLGGSKCFPYMGCYGVGVSRLVGAYAEIFGTEKSMKWPASVAPFKAHIIGSDEPKSAELCKSIEELDKSETYYDDRKTSYGEKMAVADLIGAPTRVVLGKKEAEQSIVQINGSTYKLEEGIANLKKILAS